MYLIKKVALVIVITTRKLHHYFHSHEVVAKTDLPINQVLRKPKIAGRLVNWSIELLEFNLRYEPQGPIKRKILEDFVA